MGLDASLANIATHFPNIKKANTLLDSGFGVVYTFCHHLFPCAVITVNLNTLRISVRLL